MPELLSISDVADRLGEPLHRVSYAIRACGVEPSGYFRNFRVFSNSDLPKIERALKATSERRSAESH